MKKKILALVMIQILIAGILFVVPSVRANIVDIAEVNYPKTVRQNSPICIDVSLINNGYEAINCYIKVYLRDSKHLPLDENGKAIVFYRSENFAIPARTKLTGIHLIFQIPTTVPPGKYYFEIDVFEPNTSEESLGIPLDYNYDEDFSLLEPLEPFPYWIYAICILPIILIIAGLYLKHKIGRKPQH